MNDITLERLKELGFEERRVAGLRKIMDDDPKNIWMLEQLALYEAEPLYTLEIGDDRAYLEYISYNNSVNLCGFSEEYYVPVLMGISTIQKVKDIIKVLSTTE